jgi:hypothetical protein
MMMIEFRQFRIEDAEVLCPIAIDRVTRTRNYMLDARLRMGQGPAFTGVIGDEIVCAFGMAILRPNIGSLWGVFSPKIRTCKKSFLWSAKTILQVVIDQWELKKIRAFARTQPGCILLKHLGFVKARRMWKDQYLWLRM